MQTTTTQPALSSPAAAQPASTGFQLPCPCCGEPKANISLNFVDLGYTCQECNADFTADDVRTFIARWSAVLAWVEAAPQLPNE